MEASIAAVRTNSTLNEKNAILQNNLLQNNLLQNNLLQNNL